MEQTEETGKVIAIFGALFGFGVIYNAVVSWLGRHGYSEGYTAILVAVGVGVTLIGILPLIGVANTLKVLAAFAASGTPMALGDMQRYARSRKTMEWLYANGTEGMAGGVQGLAGKPQQRR